ncbi:MAG: metallophosphoesterase [Planctomycetaceae bacterium]|nr:metallophosphoesterase [Planctomycetaceae bacterium]
MTIPHDRVFFTSDLHFNHQNLIKFCGRPFHTAGEMNEKLIKWFNEAVGPSDTVYVLGDLVVGSDLSCAARLNGRKLLLMGNHDTLPPEAYEDIGIEVIRENESPAKRFMYEGFQIVHSPAPVMREVFPAVSDGPDSYRAAQRKGVLNKVSPPCVCGHVHRNFRKLGNFVNVSVDVWDYRPALWEAVREAFQEPDSSVFCTPNH